MWNARICGVLRLNRLIRVALFLISIYLASPEHLVISCKSLLAIAVPGGYKHCASANQAKQIENFPGDEGWEKGGPARLQFCKYSYKVVKMFTRTARYSSME
jgi:hypothetical protein